MGKILDNWKKYERNLEVANGACEWENRNRKQNKEGIPRSCIQAEP
jgi:hypothetical protein